MLTIIKKYAWPSISLYFCKIRLVHLILLTLFFAGFFFRYAHFFSDRSLWWDEAFVAIDIVELPLSRLLVFDSVFPEQPKQSLLFYFFTKISSLLFGIHESALRLYPFILSMLGLFLFYKYIQKHCEPVSRIIAFGLFSLSPLLIYYSAEVKQYGTDPFFTVLLLFCFDWLYKNEQKNLIYPAVCGSLFIWSSHSLVFLLASFWIIFFIKALIKKQIELCLRWAMVGICWLFNFYILYSLAFSHMVINGDFKNAWKNIFLPWPLDFTCFFKWANNIASEASIVTAVGPWIFVLFLLTSGVVYLFNKNKYLAKNFFIPICLTIGASSFHLYPFSGRFILFLTPIFFILISEGLTHTVKNARKAKNFLLLFFLIILCAPLLQKDIENFVKGYQKEEIRPLIEIYVKNQKPEDKLFISNEAQFAYCYYHSFFRMPSAPQNFGKIWNLTHNRNYNKKLIVIEYLKHTYSEKSVCLAQEKDFSPHSMKIKKAWFLISHYDKKRAEIFFKYLQARKGRKIKTWQLENARLDLYDLSAFEYVIEPKIK